MGFRRKIALWICPNLDPALWVLSLEYEATCSAASVDNVFALQNLDALLASYHGKALIWRDLKPVIGAPANVGHTRMAFVPAQAEPARVPGAKPRPAPA